MGLVVVEIVIVLVMMVIVVAVAMLIMVTMVMMLLMFLVVAMLMMVTMVIIFREVIKCSNIPLPDFSQTFVSFPRPIPPPCGGRHQSLGSTV